MAGPAKADARSSYCRRQKASSAAGTTSCCDLVEDVFCGLQWLVYSVRGLLRELLRVVRACSHRELTKDTSDTKGAVESETATNNVGHDTPERGANAETEEESESRVSDLVRVDAEFFGHGRECQGNTLEPEAGEHVSAR